MRRTVVLLLLLLVSADTMHATRRRPIDRRYGGERGLTAAQWVARHAVPFATDAPRSGFADLEPLRAMVGDARIVALGEATHGTREFFTMKHRIFEFLVEEMGFTVFALEAGLPDTEKLNAYVQGAGGHPAVELASLFYWPWSTHEVLDLIAWMREYNARRGDRKPVQFRAFDMQGPAYAMKHAGDYLHRVDPAGAESIIRLWQCYSPYRNRRPEYTQLPVETQQRCRDELAEMYALFESRRADYVARSSSDEFELHLRYARVMQQAEAVAARRGNRDAFMAENTVWLANVAHPDEKLVLWAHNAHVSAQSLSSMGGHLRIAFPGRQMVIVGFAFGEGEFNASQRTDYVIGPHAVGRWNGGLDALLWEAAMPRMMLDLRDVESEDARRRFSTRDTLWGAGAFFVPPVENHRWPVVLLSSYDVLIWFAQTTPTRLSRTVGVPPP